VFKTLTANTLHQAKSRALQRYLSCTLRKWNQ